MTVEDLDIVAQVEDQFTTPLDRLEEMIYDVGVAEESVFPIDVDVRGVTKAETELLSLASTAETIDDVDIGADVGENQLFQGFRQTPGIGGGSDKGEAVTSGGRDKGFLTRRDLNNLRRVLGDAFDEEIVVDFEGQVSEPSRLVRGGFGPNIRTGELTEALFDDDSDVDLDLLSGLGSTDTDVFTETIEEMRELDLVTGDLANENRSLLRRMQDVSPKMGTFFALFAAILPLLFTFIGALPAAIAGVVALGGAAIGAAGALAAIGGLGLMGMGMEGGQFSMDALSEEWEELRKTFIEAFAPLATTFAPVVEDLIDDVGRLFETLGQMRVLQSLRDEFSAIGDALVRVIPPLIAGFVELGEAAAPVLGDLVGFLATIDWGELFTDILRQTLPFLYNITDAILTMLPALFKLSMGFLSFVSILMDGVSALFAFIDMLGPLAPLLGVLISIFLTLVTVVSLYSKVTELAAAVTGFFSGTAVSSAVSSLQQLTIYQLLAAEASLTMASAFAAALEVITLGLATIAIGYFVTQLVKINNQIGGIRDKMKGLSDTSVGSDFGGLSGSSSSSANPYYVENNYNVNAPNREAANRTTESLRYGSTYQSGAKADNNFSG